jgi:(1->4)-alpha-D-glucan 1-alpha-D-glucosylmutase
VEGTVGYEFANDVVALFAEPAAAAPLTELWEELSGDARPFADWAADAKLEQARTTFAADIDWLRRLRPGVERLEQALSALPVYRTYIRDEPSAEDRAVLAEAGIEDWLAGASPEFVTRFQQLTPPIMAKGVEDTAFYRYARLLALNDVGGDPGRFSIGAEAFHAGNAERARRFPRHMLASQTHDSKRSGDVRARLIALTWMAADWVAQARRWRELCAPLRTDGAPDAVEEHTIHQTLVGAWPIDPDRLCEFMRKAMREAKVHTSWVAPDEEHERRVLGYCRALYSDPAFREAFEPFAARVAAAGELIALRQTALKLTVPGVPDIYQGDELVTLSLVDPDNRRAVDWRRAREPDGPDARKSALVRDLLALRARRPDAFAGSYEPLAAGPDAVAFVRGGEIAVAVPVRGDATVPGVPGEWVPAGSFPAGITVLERAVQR